MRPLYIFKSLSVISVTLPKQAYLKLDFSVFIAAAPAVVIYCVENGSLEEKLELK